ncbi:hypothetical protein PV664_37290 [Streptomyces sp. ME01-18a]|uniref:hypothetical protein n=1 Tax=Streptomyces sp. ME01-18a TaxID=3028669 RepID=UPI0029A4E127|nr:hypothetical protein [Streptomyces sp. ME01-18a]MDX3434432.1 hypothetical protein [Streptomyces sp. ME01-18a]
MRKAVRTAITAAVIGLLLSGCGSSDSNTAHAKNSSAGKQAPSTEPSTQQTMIDRASGSWKSIIEANDADALATLTVKDGKVTAKGPQLTCTGTLKPHSDKGEGVPTLMLSCKNGGDGGRGLGTVDMKGADALAIDWEGPEGGWGGPIDSFRRVG